VQPHKHFPGIIYKAVWLYRRLREVAPKCCTNCHKGHAFTFAHRITHWWRSFLCDYGVGVAAGVGQSI